MPSNCRIHTGFVQFKVRQKIYARTYILRVVFVHNSLINTRVLLRRI